MFHSHLVGSCGRLTGVQNVGVSFQVAGDRDSIDSTQGTTEELIVMGTQGFLGQRDMTRRELLKGLMRRPECASQPDMRSTSFWKAEVHV